MIKIQRRIVAAISGLGLAAASLLGITTSAQAVASTTFDCFPGANNPPSVESTGCQDIAFYHPSDGGGDGSGRIEWNNTQGVIGIRGIVTDTASNGRGPFLRVLWTNGNTGGTAIRSFHNTTGTGTTLNQYQIFRTAGRALNSKDQIRVWMCDGTFNGALANCEDIHHGPFHNY